MSQTVREIAARVLKYQEQIGDIEALAGHVLALLACYDATHNAAGQGFPSSLTEDIEPNSQAVVAAFADLRAQLQAAQNERAYYKKLSDELGELADERGREVERLRAKYQCRRCRGTGIIDVRRGIIHDTDTAAEVALAYRQEPCPVCTVATPAATPPAQEHPDTAASFMFLNPLDQSPMIAKTFEATRQIALEYLGREDWAGEHVTKLGIYRVEKVGEVTAPEAQR